MDRPLPQPTLVQETAVVFAGGFLGAIARAGLLELFPVHAGEFPWATFAANVAGAAILAFVITHTRSNGGASLRIALIGTGFCGALTTFSTLQLELYELIDQGDALLAALDLVASLVAGLLAVAATRRFVDRAGDLA